MRRASQLFPAKASIIIRLIGLFFCFAVLSVHDHARPLNLLSLPSIVSFAHGWASMQFQLPNGQNVYRNGQHWPSIGHEIHDYKNRMATAGGGSQLNAFGKMMKVEGMHWTQITCNADADGDGYTNGEELGDPDCIWTKGKIPSRTTDISHPGYKDSFPQTFKSRSQIAAEAMQKEFEDEDRKMKQQVSASEELVRRWQEKNRKKLEAEGAAVAGDTSERKSQYPFGSISFTEEELLHLSDEGIGDHLIPHADDEEVSSALDDRNHDQEFEPMPSGAENNEKSCPSSGADMATLLEALDAEQFKFLENEYLESRLRAIEREGRRRNGEVLDPEEIILEREEAEMQSRIAEFQLSLAKRRFDLMEKKKESEKKNGEDEPVGLLSDDNPHYDAPQYTNLEMPSLDDQAKLLTKPKNDDDGLRSETNASDLFSNSENLLASSSSSFSYSSNESPKECADHAVCEKNATNSPVSTFDEEL